MTLEDELKAISRLGYRLIVRGRGIVCCCRLPRPDGTSRQTYLRFGLPPTEASLDRAHELVNRLRRQIQAGEFVAADWTPAALAGSKPDSTSFADLAEALQSLFSDRYPDIPKNSSTAWGKKFLPAIKLLQRLRGEASQERLVFEIRQLQSPSSRKSTASILRGLVDHLDLGWDLAAISKAGSGYSVQDLKPRDVPTDDEVEQWLSAIKLKHWRFLVAVCWTTGIRPHEIVGAWIEPLNGRHVLRIPDSTKTGYRTVWPLPYQRFLQLGLHRKRNQAWPTQSKYNVAKSCSDYLRRRGIPIRLYELRHLFALRCMERGIPVDRAARLMGHSSKIHEQTYRRWLDRQRVDAMHAAEASAFD